MQVADVFYNAIPEDLLLLNNGIYEAKAVHSC